MGLGKLIAWLLLVATFIAAAIEVGAQAVARDFGYMSAHDVLYTLIPGKYIVFQSWVEDHLGRAAWNPALRGVLSLPAWALLGIPGLALMWRYRARPEPGEEPVPDEAYVTFEDVVAAAREADQEIGEVPPSKYAVHAEYDPTDVQPDEGEDGDAAPREIEFDIDALLPPRAR